MKESLDEGVDPNYRSKKGATPLFMAIWEDQGEILKILIESGADVDEATTGVKASGNAGALQLAAIIDSTSAAKALLKAGVPVDDLNLKGHSALHYAASKGFYEMCLLLLDGGATVDLKTQDGDNVAALYMAARQGYLEVVKLLISKGADVNKNDSKLGLPPLMAAVVGNTGSIIQELIASGAKVNVKASNGWTPLFYAAVYGYKVSIKTLVKNGADKSMIVSGFSPLEALCMCSTWSDPGESCNLKACKAPKLMRKLLS